MDISKLEQLERAIKEGNCDVINKYAAEYKKNKDLSSTNKAVELYQLAINLDNSAAMYNLGKMYHYGKGVAQNYDKAIELYEQSAALGNSDAMCELACMYESGEGMVEPDLNKSIELYQKAIKLGNSGAMNDLGKLYYYGDYTIKLESDDNKAIELYQKAANFGNPCAMYNLANMYYCGEGTIDSEPDFNKAIELYQQAAELGFVQAMCNLADMYCKGLGIEKDSSSTNKAIELYYEAKWYINVRYIIYNHLNITDLFESLCSIDLNKVYNNQIPDYLMYFQKIKIMYESLKDRYEEDLKYLPEGSGYCEAKRRFYQKIDK